MSDDSDSFIAGISKSQSGIPEGNGIDYLRDINVAAQDVINLLKDTLQTIDRGVIYTFYYILAGFCLLIKFTIIISNSLMLLLFTVVFGTGC